MLVVQLSAKTVQIGDTVTWKRLRWYRGRLRTSPCMGIIVEIGQTHARVWRRGPLGYTGKIVCHVPWAKLQANAAKPKPAQRRQVACNDGNLQRWRYLRYRDCVELASLGVTERVVALYIGDNTTADEEVAAELGQDITRMVLAAWRPSLMEGANS